MKRYIRLYEGKKQAVQLLQKAFGQRAKAIVNSLEELDVTSPKNKYIELFAKIFLNKYKGPLEPGMMTDFRGRFADNEIRKKITDIEKRSLKMNLSKIKTFIEFVREVNKAYSTVTRSKAKMGIKGLTKGKDYLEIPLSHELLKAYIPLSHKASKIIASDKVGQCVGQWCTAQNSSEYWDSYIKENGGILAYVINYDVSHPADYKHAKYFHSDKKNTESFDARDTSISNVWFNKEIDKYVYKNWDKIREKLPKQERIKELTGITMPELKKKFPWIFEAQIKGAIIEVRNNVLVWRGGTWISGTWEDGNWKLGTWKDGVWKNGLWEGGTWLEGTWEKGIWQYGTWRGGGWRNGTWEGGVWEDGLWENGKWENGTWKYGYWVKGQWSGGSWEEGTWGGGVWDNGVWHDGTWYKGVWWNGMWFRGKIYDTELGEYVKSSEDPSEYYEQQNAELVKLARE